jgi:hypothetical protein
MTARVPLQVIRESAAVQDKMLEVRRQLCPVWCSSHNNSQSRHVFWRLRSCTSAPKIYSPDRWSKLYICGGWLLLCQTTKRISDERVQVARRSFSLRDRAQALDKARQALDHAAGYAHTHVHTHTYILDAYLRSAGAHPVTEGVGLLGSKAGVMTGRGEARSGLPDAQSVAYGLLCVCGAAGSMSSDRRQYELGWNGARHRYGTRLCWTLMI